MTESIINQETILERRRKINDFEKIIAQCPGAVFGDTNLCPLEHFFQEGVYVRKITIPKGMACVGKIHKHRHANFLMQGKATVFTESHGSQVLKAPLFMMSEPGTKRTVLALEDVVWYTIHRTDSQDLEQIEKEVIAETYEQLEAESRKELP